MSWDDDQAVTSNVRSRQTDSTAPLTIGSSGQITYRMSGNFGSTVGTLGIGSITNVVWTNYTSAASSMFAQSAITSAGGCYYNGSSGGQPMFDPAQVEALRMDFRSVKESWKRKRAEVRAKRLFRRVVGDVAYEKFLQRGYHEIRGASGTRYRLEPGRWVEVMKGCADQVDYELCAHLEIGIPWFDTMVVQHLMLTSGKESEDKFLGIANRHAAGYYPLEELNRRAG